jgi:hypothetical protein
VEKAEEYIYSSAGDYFYRKRCGLLIAVKKPGKISITLFVNLQ